MWEDLFSADTWNTVQRGIGTAGSAFNALAPIINRGAQLAAGIEGTRRAGDLAAARGAAQTSLDQLFTPGGEYAQELRKQLERRDAAAGRRSQYGTRETELMAKLAQQRASVLTNPQYAAYLTGAQQSPYGPLAGAVGSLTGGQQQQGGSNIPNTPPGTSNALNYLYDALFAPAADAGIAAGIGGAGQALGASGLGNVGLMGAEGLSGTTGLLPGYAEAGGPQAAGIFGEAPAATAPGAGLGGFAEGAAMLPGYASTAGTGAGLFGGSTAFGAGAPGVSGLSGLLPGYTSTAGTGAASGLFGAGAGEAAGAAAGGAGGAGAGGAGGAAAAGVPAYGAALPIAVLIGGLMSMFQSGTSPEDIAGGLKANQGNLNQDTFRQYQAENPFLNALVNESMTNGQFDLGKYSQMAQRSNIGGKQFTGQALQDVLGFGQTLQQNPNWFQGPAATHSDWQSDLAATYGGE